MTLKHIIACLSCGLALSACYDYSSTGYTPYGSTTYGSSTYGSTTYGSTTYGSTTYGSATYGRSTSSPQVASATSNYHGSYTSPPPAAPTSSSSTRTSTSYRSSTGGDVGKPFVYPTYQVEKPDSVCGYPRTDCRVDQSKLPGGVSTPGTGGYLPSKVIPQ
jgi:hypothetical protein